MPPNSTIRAWMGGFTQVPHVKKVVSDSPNLRKDGMGSASDEDHYLAGLALLVMEAKKIPQEIYFRHES